MSALPQPDFATLLEALRADVESRRAQTEAVRANTEALHAIREDARAILSTRADRSVPVSERDPEQLLSVREAAKEVGCDVKSIRSAISLGRLVAVNPGVRQTRIRRAALLDYLEHKTRKPRKGLE